jgi:hypothetical protein
VLCPGSPRTSAERLVQVCCEEDATRGAVTPGPPIAWESTQPEGCLLEACASPHPIRSPPETARFSAEQLMVLVVMLFTFPGQQAELQRAVAVLCEMTHG